VLKDNVITLSDYGYIDEEGFVCLLGRAGDVIISGGQKINPTEVEDCALKSGLFTECVCYGQSDEIFGKVVKLLVVMKQGVKYDEFAIKKYLIDSLENFKVPQIIEEVDHVERNKNGKIDRKFYSNK
jgi:malonyl-CoA/methylmalonyl-CoA synthetase